MPEEERISPVTFETGCAINRQMYYIASSMDLWKEADDTPHTVMWFYQEQTKEKWWYHELPGWEVSSTCFPEPDPNDVRKIYALSEDGNIERYSRNGAEFEVIEDAKGDPSGPLYGAVSRIREIGQHLYVCGGSGQVYKRVDEGWIHYDEGLLQESLWGMKPTFDDMAKVVNDAIMLEDINGLHENDVYTVGFSGFMAHHDGKEWRKLKRRTDADLNCIYVASPSDIWIAGSAGTILRGNARDGFEVVARKTMEWDFLSITSFNGDIYLAVDNGIYRFHNNRAERLAVSDQFELRDVCEIEAKDGVMWALSPKKLLRFDGNQWECFEHPNNVEA